MPMIPKKCNHVEASIDYKAFFDFVCTPPTKSPTDSPTKSPPVTSSGTFFIKYYYYTSQFLPEDGFDSLDPISTDTTYTINYRLGNGSFGSSGRSDFVGALFEGDIFVYPPIKTICVTSDDGSKLFLNNNLVINNDGLHGDVKKFYSDIQ